MAENRAVSLVVYKVPQSQHLQLRFSANTLLQDLRLHIFITVSHPISQSPCNVSSLPRINMQTPAILPPRPRKRGRGAMASCGECRRRKQKVCHFSRSCGALSDSIQCYRLDDGPCRNCARRYPPVECVFKSDLISGSKEKLSVGPRMMKLEAVVNLESLPKSNWKSIDPAILFDGALDTAREPLDTTSILGSTASRSIDGEFDAECATVSTPSTDKTVPVGFGVNTTIIRRSVSPGPGYPVPYGATSAYLNGPTGANLSTSRRNAELLHFCIPAPERSVLYDTDT